MERDPTTGEMRKMWRLPPAIEAAREGRGTGVWGMPVGGRGMRFNYGWPKYGPVSHDSSSLLLDLQCYQIRDLSRGRSEYCISHCARSDGRCPSSQN